MTSEFSAYTARLALLSVQLLTVSRKPVQRFHSTTTLAPTVTRS